ncbi:hypothetical protein ACFVWN_07520 [Nocardiopsis flavescens]|uniref:hypothetical protein n=1 Tax=Nocardiopsis flavescens TaxID=758803 RepID=UPI00364FDE8C
MTAYFAIGTNFHVMEAYFLKRMQHEHEPSVLLIAGGHRAFTLGLLSQEMLRDIWDDIVDLRTCNESQISHLCDEFSARDSYYLFSISPPYSTACELLRRAPKGMRRIISYDGILSYQMLRWSHFASAPQVDLAFLGSIDEFLVLNKTMCVEQGWSDRTTELPIRQWLSCGANLALACRELNLLFRYTYRKESFPSWIFFDRYFSSSIGQERESWLLRCVLQSLQGVDLAIKVHPSDDPDKYNGSAKLLISDIGIPWELMQLNRKLNKHVEDSSIYVTYTSSAVLHGAELLGISNYSVIVIERIVENYLGRLLNPILDGDAIGSIFRRFADSHPGVTVYDPSNFQEFRDLVCDLAEFPYGDIGELSKDDWKQILARVGCPADAGSDLRLGLNAASMTFAPEELIRYSMKGGTKKDRGTSQKLIEGASPRFIRTDGVDADLSVICDAESEIDGRPYCFGYGVYFEYSFYQKLINKLRHQREIYVLGNLPEVRRLSDILSNQLPSAFCGLLKSERSEELTGYPILELADFERAPGRVVVVCGNDNEHILLEKRGLVADVDFYFGTLFQKYTLTEAQLGLVSETY